jgi:hypothetical protein
MSQTVGTWSEVNPREALQTAEFVCKGVAAAAGPDARRLDRIWVCRPAAGFAVRTCQYAVSEVRTTSSSILAWQEGPGRPPAGRGWPRLDSRRALYIGVCGNSVERRWNERILGLRITPSRISIARPMVWSRSQAPGPSITVRRCGISASLISQVAEFHR